MVGARRRSERADADGATVAISSESHEEADKEGAREQALDAIDFEIGESRATHQGGGWTLWAVLAALAANLWLISDVVKNDSVSTHLVLRMFFLGSLVLDCVIGIGMALGIEGPLFPPRSERRLAHGWIAPPVSEAEVVLNVARNGVLLWVVASLWPDVTGWARKIAYVYLAVPIVGLVLIAALGVLRLPQRVGRTMADVRGTRIFVWSVIAVIPVTLVGYVPAFVKIGPRPRVPDVRLAGLLVVLAFLLAMIARLSKSSPRLGSLIDLRRDVVNGRIAPAAALLRLDTIVGGKKTADAVGEAVGRVLDMVNRTKSWYEAARAAADQLETHALTKAVPKAAVDIWWKRSLRPLVRAQKKLVKEQRRCERRLRILTWNDPVATDAANLSSTQLLVEAHAAAEEWGRQIADLLRLRKSLLEGPRRPADP
jgi:hypothetical protein